MLADLKIGLTSNKYFRKYDNYILAQLEYDRYSPEDLTDFKDFKGN